MKLPVILAPIVLAASVVGLVQHRELAALRERSAGLRVAKGSSLAEQEVGGNSRPGGSDVSEGGSEKESTKLATASDPEHAGTPKVPSPSVDMAALDFVQRAEEAIKGGSMLQVATKLVPELNRASPEMLKAVLLHLDSADVPVDARLMAYSTILSKLVKTEPEAAVAEAIDVVGRMGAPHASGVFRKVLETWAANDPVGLERWFETAQQNGTIPAEPEMLYAFAAAEVAGIAAERDLGEAWAMIEGNADSDQALTTMLAHTREAIGSVADWDRMADFALETTDENLSRHAAWMLADPNFRHGTPAEQIVHADRIVEKFPRLATVYADRAISRAGETGASELADWALPRVHEGQQRALIDYHIGRWAKREPEAVEEWVGAMEPGELREMVRAAIDGVKP